jgi:SAM-dependent methyltransferase
MSSELHAYYELGKERQRLSTGAGRLEWLRTIEIIGRHLPPPPADIADIGGGPGRHSAWLAERGHRVVLRDVVPLHIDQARADLDGRLGVDIAVGDATDIDLPDRAVDVVVLLGPLYHLPDQDDRRQALAEARRILRPDGVLFAAAITPWAQRLHLLTTRRHRELPDAGALLERAERTGVLDPLVPGGFTGYAHRPDQLVAELGDGGFEVVELVAVEGPAALLPDLDDRLDDPVEADAVLGAARAVEREPSLLGVSPHLLAIARCAR